MSATTLRRNHMSVLRGFRAYSPLLAWSVFLGFVGQIAGLGVLGVAVLNLDIHWGAMAGLVFAIQLLIATRLRGLNNIVHECSHASFCSDRRQNDRIGRLAASLLLGSFSRYKAEHMTHHMHLGDYQRDEDLKRLEPLGLHDALTSRVILRHLLTPLVGRHLPYYLSVNVDGSDGEAYRIFKVAILFLGMAFAYYDPVLGALLLVIPRVLIFTALNYWADCIDHAGLTEEEDDLASSRNVLVPALVRVVFFPRSDSFHLVHHLFPTVPAAHLSSAHDVLRSDPIYATRTNAVGSGGSFPVGSTSVSAR